MIVPTDTEPEVDRRIVACCKLLDEVVGSPDWDRLIRLDLLYMSSGHYCVLGQTGNNSYGTSQAFVPWFNYSSGVTDLQSFWDEHPDIAERIGATWDEVKDVFSDAIVDLDQDNQWRAYLTWRIQSRDRAVVEPQS